MLLLPFQWGGTNYAWNSPTIIGLFIGFGVGASVWMAWEYRLGYGALFPVRYMKNRSIIGAGMCAFFSMMILWLVTYYVPLRMSGRALLISICILTLLVNRISSREGGL